ncbi:glycosyltransferase family 2 protein [Cerasicoccus frondis]|uniref:glycosyltransferase family 2 protein n=1 Tax=Cerasicoccus frondis TaxID=490090 RepID=UPI002852704A|nr:glycosyltransferase family 2 protein [Cerasicoccus frondis]
MKISVLTPSYNAERYLERAIQSVLIQDDPDFEHIVVDGGSTDGTVQILERHQHIKWISEKDRGQSDAMNKAFALSTGDVIVYLNADDWFEANVFQHVRAMFKAAPEHGLVIGNLYDRREGSEAVGLTKPVKDYRRCLQYYKYRFPLNPVSYFYRREVQEATGPFPEELHFAMDYWFILRALSKFSVCESDLVFGTFYFTDSNKTSQDDCPETPHMIVTRHIREYDPSVRCFFLRKWYLYHYGVEFFERIKSPIRRLVYHAFFRRHLTLSEYRKLGFRAAFRQGRGANKNS